MQSLRRTNGVCWVLLLSLGVLLSGSLLLASCTCDDGSVPPGKPDDVRAQSISEPEAPESGTRGTRPQLSEKDRAFFAVPLNSYEQSPCSPDFPEPPEVGLRVAAPRQLPLSASTTFPLCGTLQIPARELVTYRPDPIEAIVVRVQNVAGTEAFRFTLQPHKARAHPPGPGPSPDRFSKTDIRRTYFNVDLLTFSETLRQKLGQGRYRVWATLGQHRSEPVEVAVVRSAQ